MTTDELAERLAIWLRLQDSISQVEILNDEPPFNAPPEAFVGQAFMGFVMDGVGMSLTVSVTE